MSYHQSRGLINIRDTRLYHEAWGEPDRPTILLVMGAFNQMTLWPDSLIQSLVSQGYRVIAFDNRDSGLSGTYDQGIPVNLLGAFAWYQLGRTFAANYNLYDLAEDTLGLMDALEVPSAHIVGWSMGGMVGQILAARQPQRVDSLTLISSSCNDPRLPLPGLGLMMDFLLTSGARAEDEHTVVKTMYPVLQRMESPDFPMGQDALEKRIQLDFQRSWRPASLLRQMQGILATGSLRRVARKVRLPALIIHGTKDTFIRPKSARMSGRLIKGSRLELVKGFGHDLPEPLGEKFAQWIDETARFAQPMVQT